MPAVHKSTLAYKSIVGLDVGNKRIGVALASLSARLPQPLSTLPWDDNFFSKLEGVIEKEAVGALVVGLPRGLQGQHTAQTQAVESFVEELRQRISLPIHMQDEALTSQHAEAELQARGKVYDRAAIDALAATYILGDFLTEHPVLDASGNPEQQKHDDHEDTEARI
jgi:putative Holliday junction resolvase